MKIFRKNYFSSNLFEKAEYSSGTPEHLKPDTKLVEIVDILKRAQIKHRQNDEFLKWAYWYLINDEAGGVKSYYPNNPLKRLEKFFNYQKYLGSEKKDIPVRIDDWIEQCCTEDSTAGKPTHVLVSSKNGTYIGTDKNIGKKEALRDDRNALEELKRWHEISVKTFEEARKVKIETVLDFMDNPKWPKEESHNKNLPSEYHADILQLPIPTVDKDAIEKLAQDVDTSDYDSISGFGSQIQLQTKKALAQLAHYFTTQATKPNHTIELVESIIEEAQAIDITSLVHDDPTGFSKLLNIVRAPQLTKPADMPTAIIVEKAQHLPDMAIQDDESYSKDLAILQHGINILDAYYTSLDLHHKALQKRAEQEKEDKAEPLSLGGEIARYKTKHTLEEKVNALEASLHFAKAHAFNFGTIAATIAKTRIDLDSVAGIATTVQIPALSAIRQFHAYQYRRFKLLGRAVNESVMAQSGGQSPNLIDIKNATPEATRKSMTQSMAHLIEGLQSLNTKLIEDMTNQDKIITTIEGSLASGKAIKVELS